MGRANLKLRPGVVVNDTPALNEAGWSFSQAIRFTFDPILGGVAEKLGGWTRFFPNAIVSTVRNLWAWEDTESFAHLAVGAQNRSGTFESQLSVITEGSQVDVTPREQTDNISPDAESTLGSALITINDTTIQDITQYDAVYIPAHISIGGVVLFGLYQCDPLGTVATTSYDVIARDKLGDPLPATATSTTATVALFNVVNGSPIATVTLADHGYQGGNTYPVLIPLEVGAVTFFGNFEVREVLTADTFTIVGPNSATSTTSASINGGKARYMFNFGIGAIPPGTGFGIGGFGRGGFGVGEGITPNTGFRIRADDWSFGNWAEILLACPETSPIVLTTTGTSGGGVTGTVTFAESYLIAPGLQVTVSGVTPNAWNGTYTATASTTSSVSFLTTETTSATVMGQIAVETVEFEPIYMWDAEHSAPVATVIPNAPPVNDGFFVAMPQKQIVAWGSTFTGVPDPLLVRWCDVNNFNVWIGQATNQAGSYRFPRGSRIVGGYQGPQQGFLWTDTDAWTMQYISQPYVYSFNMIGVGMGLLGRKAAGGLYGVVYWMGPSQFYIVDDSGAQVLPCPIWDVVFQDMNTDIPNLIRFASNTRFNEVAWYYAPDGSTTISRYVKYNVLLKVWDYGDISRSAWVDQSVLGPPIGADSTTNFLYQHETSQDADGAALVSSVRSGYAVVGDGEFMTFVDQWWPDMKWGYYGGMDSATVSITLHGANTPGETPTVYGPFNVTQATTYFTTRFRHRLLSIEVSSADVGSWWRVGLPRYRFAPDGRF